MINLRTNLSSIITQTSMIATTDRLNQAIECMSTGYKINHASDNAANYAIANDISSKISSLDVVTDNIAMGIDLLTAASDTINLLEDRTKRLNMLWTQANNGTYGEQQLKAMNEEAQAIVDEINRVYSLERFGCTEVKRAVKVSSKW